VRRRQASAGTETPAPASSRPGQENRRRARLYLVLWQALGWSNRRGDRWAGVVTAAAAMASVAAHREAAVAVGARTRRRTGFCRRFMWRRESSPWYGDASECSRPDDGQRTAGHCAGGTTARSARCSRDAGVGKARGDLGKACDGLGKACDDLGKVRGAGAKATWRAGARGTRTARRRLAEVVSLCPCLNT
jgi:hypothetical protein